MNDKFDPLLPAYSFRKRAKNADGINHALACRLPQSFAIQSIRCMARRAPPQTISVQPQRLLGNIRDATEPSALDAFARPYDVNPYGRVNATKRTNARQYKMLCRTPLLDTEGQV